MTATWRRAGVVLLAALCLSVAYAAAAPAGGGSLEGRWKLVEQNYGKGKMNLADLEAPMMLEFTRDVTGGLARMWIADGFSEALTWPAYVGDDGPATFEILERSADPASGRAFARCRVKPSAGSDLVLVIVEEYIVADGGEALRGSVTVTFTDGEETRGSYILHRRFERVP